jgi:hypothetical protein
LHRNCLLQQVIEGQIKGGIEVTGRWGRRCRKLLDDLKERRGYSHIKEEALDCTMWRACFGRSFGPVVRQTTKWMNEWTVRRGQFLRVGADIVRNNHELHYDVIVRLCECGKEPSCSVQGV